MSSKIEEICPALGRLRKGYTAACRIASTHESRWAWVGVYPLHCHEHLRHKGDYRIRVFEVERRYLIDDNDVWEGTMENLEDAYVFGEENLVTRLRQFIDPNFLGPPSDCEYPV